MKSTETLFRSAPNFRELGGLSNAQGRRVRHGRVFRSELLASLDAAELATLRGLQIRTVFDLRNPHEQAAAKPDWPTTDDAVQWYRMEHELPVAGADLRQLVKNLKVGALNAQGAEGIMRDTYRKMPEHYSDVIGELFNTLNHADAGAALVHCTAGKDRTGFVCAMLLSALDVPMNTILQDYLASAQRYTLQRLLDRLEQTSELPVDAGMTDALSALVQVKAAYLEEAIAAIEAQWGSVSTYLAQRSGLDEKARAQLKAQLLE